MTLETPGRGAGISHLCVCVGFRVRVRDKCVRVRGHWCVTVFFARLRFPRRYTADFVALLCFRVRS